MIEVSCNTVSIEDEAMRITSFVALIDTRQRNHN